MNGRDESAAGRGREPRERSVRGGRWRAPAAVAGLVLAASVVPVPGWPGADGGAVLLPAWVGLTTPFHLIGYAALAAVTGRAVGGRGRPAVRSTVRAAAVGVAVATAFGFGVELVQAPIPWRSFAWVDAAVNTVGAAVGAGGFAAWRAVWGAGGPE